MRRFDVAAMFASLWLLASMILDIATPKELTVYMIGAATAPATVITALLYWLRVPRLDFAVSFTTLWLVSGMAIELNRTADPLGVNARAPRNGNRKRCEINASELADENVSPNNENSKREAIQCPACASLHFIDRSNGKLLGDHQRI